MASELALKDPTLHRDLCRIGGKWIAADSGETVSVLNPATGAEIGTVPYGRAVEARRAVEAAEASLPAWRSLLAKERSRLLRRWFDLVIDNQEDLARLLTAEQGKPYREALAEVVSGAQFIEWFAEEARRAYGETIPAPARDRRVVVIKQPVGVCAAITPWNFPNTIITRKAAAALAAGCTMVIRPATETPYSALALAELASRAGIPDGVLNVVTGDAHEMGLELTTNPVVRKLSFTGSTRVGRILMRQSSSTVKKLALELGGNAPFIVFDDADVEAAVEGAVASKFRNTGQACVGANRFYVHDAVYDEFARKLAERVRALKVGDGTDPETTVGPLIGAEAVGKVEEHIFDAVEKGARVLVGGRRHEFGGSFFEPTVLTDVPRDAMVSREETFGPLAPLFRFSDEAELVEAANDTEYGLAAYVYSRDIGRVWRIAEAIETGMVGINVGLMANEAVPFGGIKESGVGREGSHYGIEDYLEVKYICMGGL
ncbi:NAD-dependent succinate-semialdehyde dehydrogenase [Amycolatopsis rubida]|uniref:NAD-dependent succinate-semialdehyde dehydrogenase n=1 Tax=Amycolatopsis rubida TaxID=112413 RepID=A0ABX0C3H7_9PSEU|nr:MULTISPECIES: NAD-dependent succinate-semialdehyde dehydrogenase [Amycolatopsis]MYW96131.1 succinate-semialdehyde dehydrogenase [Amycolatopsis rubida]NEC61122.1 NAD-dependent succinate-semialdehyde dehydrogenase [Amycolatopsis rubida]OAP23355.1 Glutarate-semialdehyde dehydrogenase DavD [Amycolatopsis sp. M39]